MVSAPSGFAARLLALKREFVLGLPSRLAELDGWRQRSPEPLELKRIAHRLRGVAKTHGFTELGERAADTEVAVAEGDRPEALAAHAAALREAIAKVIASEPAASPEERAAPPPAAPAPPRQPPAAAAPRALSGRRVVAIDDEPAMRRLLGLTLSDLGGASASVVGTPAELIMELSKAPADLLIADVMMPGESGPELLVRLRAMGLIGGARVVVLSASLQAELAGRDLDPTWVWLTKPFRPPELCAALAKLLA